MQLLAPSKHNCNCNCCNKHVCPCSLSAFLQAEINISLQLVSQCGLKCLFYQRSVAFSVATVYCSHTQLQSAVQESPERKHVHLRLQPFLQAHLVSSWQLAAIGGSVVQHIHARSQGGFDGFNRTPPQPELRPTMVAIIRTCSIAVFFSSTWTLLHC